METVFPISINPEGKQAVVCANEKSLKNCQEAKMIFKCACFVFYPDLSKGWDQAQPRT